MKIASLVIAFLFLVISNAQEIQTIRPVVQSSHNSPIYAINGHPEFPLVLSSDGGSSKLWNIKSNSNIQSFPSDYACFNKDGRILTLTSIGDDQSRVALYDVNTLEKIKEVEINAEYEKVFWSKDKERMLINSGRSNFSQRANVILNPRTLEVIHSFWAYNVLAENDQIGVVYYKRKGRGSYQVASMDFNGKEKWKKNLSKRFISCCSSTDFKIVDGVLMFKEFSYIFDFRLDYQKEFVLENGSKPKNVEQLWDKYEFFKKASQVKSDGSKFYGLNGYSYRESYNSKFVELNESGKNIELHKGRGHHSFNFSPGLDSAYLGFKDGHFEILDLKQKKIVFVSKQKTSNQSKIRNAIISGDILYSFTKNNRLYALNLSNLAFSEIQANFSHHDVNIISNDQLGKMVYFSEQYDGNYITINESNYFYIVENGITRKYKGRPLTCNADKTIILVENPDKLALFDLKTEKETVLDINIPDENIMNAKFSPDGKTLALVINDELFGIDVLSNGIKKFKMKFDLNQTVSHKSPGFKKRTYRAYEEADIQWNINSDIFNIRLGSILSTVFSGCFTTELKRLSNDKMRFTREGNFRVGIRDKNVLLLEPLYDGFQSREVAMQSEIYGLDCEIIPGASIVRTEDEIWIVNHSDGSKKKIEIEGYQKYSLPTFSYLEQGEKKLLGYKLFGSYLAYYDLNTSKKVKEFSIPEGTYNLVNTRNGKEAILYDYIYQGDLFCLDYNKLETNNFRSGLQPILWSHELFGMALGYYDNLSKSYSEVIRHSELRRCKSLSYNNPNDKYFMAYHQNGDLIIYDADSKRELFRYFLSDGQFMLRTPDNYYAKSAELKELKFGRNQKLYGFEQFDLKYNRPDIIIERLGFTSPNMIKAYKRAYEKRLAKLGFTEEMLSDDFELPELKIQNFEALPASVDTAGIDLMLQMIDEQHKLDRINVWVNNVAIFGKEGINLRNFEAKELTKKLNIPLARGTNKIQLSVLNQAGAESFKEEFNINCNVGKEKADLYVISIGESKFKESAYNLDYAAKDANDIAKLFKESKIFGSVYTKVLINEEVTEKNIAQLDKFLEKADINDEVIIFVADHGVLDENLDYYLATYNMDFQNPSKYGLEYDKLETLLDGIKPLRKTMLLDACHSGEIDKDEVEFSDESLVASEGIKFRSVGNKLQSKLGLQNTAEITASLFSDLRKGTGATIISSAGGMEFAIESENWNNGLFTYCFIDGIKSMKADYNSDGEIWLSEIKKYVYSKVNELSNGLQQPTSRIENELVDFRIW